MCGEGEKMQRMDLWLTDRTERQNIDRKLVCEGDFAEYDTLKSKVSQEHRDLFYICAFKHK